MSAVRWVIAAEYPVSEGSRRITMQLIEILMQEWKGSEEQLQWQTCPGSPRHQTVGTILGGTGDKNYQMSIFSQVEKQER